MIPYKHYYNIYIYIYNKFVYIQKPQFISVVLRVNVLLFLYYF